MKKLILISAVLFIVALASSCTKNTVEPEYDPPADHTISQDGFMHKTGLNDPETNCVACHGADLRGGSTGVSCFECHSSKWEDPPADHTLSKDGYNHKPGLNDPLANCISCHGTDLRGGITDVSCYQCHGAEWDK